MTNEDRLKDIHEIVTGLRISNATIVEKINTINKRIESNECKIKDIEKCGVSLKFKDYCVLASIALTGSGIISAALGVAVQILRA